MIHQKKRSKKRNLLDQLIMEEAGACALDFKVKKSGNKKSKSRSKSKRGSDAFKSSNLSISVAGNTEQGRQMVPRSSANHSVSLKK